MSDTEPDDASEDVGLPHTTKTSFAPLSDTERASLRSELSTFLLDFKTKLGSDGQQLVHYPDNFDVVSNAMNRSDLSSTSEEAPWSKYLLSDNATFHAALDTEGRYRGVSLQEDNNSKSAKIEKGLAQIHLLDNQLLTVNRKAAQVKASLLQQLEEAEGGGAADSPNSGRKSARSTQSSKYDSTFMTRNKSDRSVAGHSNDSHQSSPVQSSRRSEPFEEEERQHEGQDAPAISPLMTATSEKASSHRNRGVIRSGNQNKNFMEANIKAVRSHASLSYEEEMRVRSLLDIDEQDEAWQALSKFGFTEAQKEQLAQMDTKIAAFGHADRVTEVSIQQVPANSNAFSEDFHSSVLIGVASKKNAPNFLAEQRAAREQHEYSTKLDGMLRCFTTELLDLSGLLSEEAAEVGGASSSSSSSIGGSFSASTILDVPPYSSQIRVGRSVTTDEIVELVQSAKLHTFSNLQELQTIEEEAEREEGSASSSSTSLQHLRTVLASRIDIDRLLSSLRPEINRLASLRQSMHRSMSQGSSFSESACSSSSASSRLHHQRSQELSEAMYDIHEMEDDIAMRYGDASTSSAHAQSPQKKGKASPRKKTKIRAQQQQYQQQDQQRQRQHQHHSHLMSDGFAFEDDHEHDDRETAFALPSINHKSQTHASIDAKFFTSTAPTSSHASHASLPLISIAASFRSKIQKMQLRVQRGVIGNASSEEYAELPHPPPQAAPQGDNTRRLVI